MSDHRLLKLNECEKPSSNIDKFVLKQDDTYRLYLKSMI